MNRTNRFLKNPALLTLAAGLVIGGVSIASLHPGSQSTLSAPMYQPPLVSVSAEKPTGSGLAGLKALDASFTQLAEYASPAVVSIRTETKSQQTMFGQTGAMAGEGSGVIFRPDGWIVTNDHVVGGADKVTVVLHDGRELSGEVRRAEDSDLAVVKIDAKDLPTLRFADSNAVKPGQFAMAIGAPFGFENSVTIGHISAKQRDNRIGDPQTGSSRNYFDLIQTDTPINMGNSGGPLINVDGEVVGINTAILSTTGGSNGIGFAISSNLARYLAETLIEKGKVVRSYVGVVPQDVKEFQRPQFGVDNGAQLVKVPSDGPAAMAGLKEGDVVVQIGNLPVTGEVDFRNAMFRFAPGSTVDVVAVRNKERKTFHVKLIAPPVEKVAQRSVQQMPDDLNMPDMPGFKDFPKFLRDHQSDQNSGTTKTGKARLGVMVGPLTSETRKQFSIPENVTGAVVTTVEPGSVADRLEIQPGDVIQAVGSKKISTPEDLVSAMSDVKWGDQKAVTYSRFGKNASTTVAKDVTFK